MAECDGCGAKVSYGNLARHKKSNRCANANEAIKPKEIIIEPNLINALTSIDDVIDVQDHCIEINVQLVRNSDGTIVTFNPISLDGFSLFVSLATDTS